MRKTRDTKSEEIWNFMLSVSLLRVILSSSKAFNYFWTRRDEIRCVFDPPYKHNPDIYSTELQLNKANTSDQTSFLDLDIKVIGSDGRTSVNDKRDDYEFPIVDFPWFSGDAPRLPSYDVYISQLVRSARCCTSILEFHFKNLQITSKELTQGYRYHKLRKTFGKFFRSCSELLSKFGELLFPKEFFTRSSTVILSTN